MMDFVKKYLVYGIYILVVLVSIGIYVWAILINGSNVKEYSSIETQYRTATTLGTKAVPDNVIQFYNENIKLAEDDKKNVLDFCKSTSSRPFLFINVFPFAPQDVSKQYYTNFAGEYCKAVENYLTTLRASDKPTALEEQNYLANSKRTNTDGGGAAVGRDPRAGGGGMMSPTGSADEKLLVEFRENRSQQISVYANLNSFVLYDFWQNHDGSTGTTASLQTDSWYSQIAHWIQEDVVLSINKINSLTKSVSENPVKRLIEVSFSGVGASSGSGSVTGGRGGRGGGGGGFTDPRAAAGGGRTSTTSSSVGVASRTGSVTALPGLVINTNDTSGTTMSVSTTAQMATPWTGHYSDEITDVYHFSTSVIISSNKINEFINSLQSSRSNADGTNSRNQITVLQYDINPVDIQAEELDGYYYGGGSLVRVNFICEYVFFKSGYDTKVPDSVKNIVTTAGAM